MVPVVKLRTFRNNMTCRMSATVAVPGVKWVSLTATLVCVLVTVTFLPLTANGFTPIGGNQNGGRKLFGGYRITPKHCRGTKTLPLTDPRSKGPTICMFNHECAQRNGEVVGACMDGFLFGACCQVPQSNANENTLIKDAQNPQYQSASHSTPSYDSALYENNQKLESNEFQEIHMSSTKYPVTTVSSYLNDYVSQKHTNKYNKTSSNSNGFYVNKGSVMVSSPSSISHDDYVMLSSSTTSSPFTGNNNKVSYMTELPTKISTNLVDHEEATNVPIKIVEIAEIKKNYSSGSLDLDMGEFTHSDITHPGADSVLLDGDLQFSTGYGGPQSVYVPPPAHAEIIPPKRRPAHRPSESTPSAKPSNDKYVLIQTLEASKKPSQTAGTTSTGISTNMESIESIILMLNGTSHGPSYSVANTSPTYNQLKPSYSQKHESHGTTALPGGVTYVSVTTVRPPVTFVTSSGLLLSGHLSTTTSPPTYFAEADTSRPTTSVVQESTEETSNKYHSVEMSDEKPSFVEIPSPPKFVIDKIDSESQVAGQPQESYNVMTPQVNYGDHTNSHKNPANPDFGYTSPAQPTSDFNKMPSVGQAYPLMDEETSEYLETSMLSEEQSEVGSSGQEVPDKDIPTNAQSSEYAQQQQYQQEQQQHLVKQQQQHYQQEQLKLQQQQQYQQQQHQEQQQKLQQQQQYQQQEQQQKLQQQQHYQKQQEQLQEQKLQQQQQYQQQEQLEQQKYQQQQEQLQQQKLQQQQESQQQQYHQQQSTHYHEHSRPSQSSYDANEETYQSANPIVSSQYQENNIHSHQEHLSQSHKTASSHNKPSSQASHNKYDQQVHAKPTSQIPSQNYQEVTHISPTTQPTQAQGHQKVTHPRPTTTPPPSTPSYDQLIQNTLSQQDYEHLIHSRPSSQQPTQDYQQMSQNRPVTQDFQKISQSGYISHPPSTRPHVKPTSQVLTTTIEVQSPSNRPISHPSTTHIIKPTTQIVTHEYEVKDESSETEHYPRPTTQLVTQSYDTAQQSDYVSQSSESEQETFQTPESQLIAQLTNQIQNGYLPNVRPSAEQPVNAEYLPRPTPQTTKIQPVYHDQSAVGPSATVLNQNNQILAQAGYFSQPPNYEKIPTPTRPALPPNRVSTLSVHKQSTTRPTIIRPTKPTKFHTTTHSEIQTFQANPTTEYTTLSSTSKPVTNISTVRPSKRPTKRVTKRPSSQKKPTTNKFSNAQQHQPPSIYSQPSPPQKFSGIPPSNHQSTKIPLKKQPPSTSYVTGPTTPRPEIETDYIAQPPSLIADKVDTVASSTPGPVYNSVYLASPTDEIILQNNAPPSTSNHHNANKPIFVKISSATQKPPPSTVIITPKPTTVNLITGSSSKRPTTTPIPTFADSNSYIYSPLVTRRPEYTSTHEYINIPQVASNDFDDPDYAGPHTQTTQTLNNVPSDDRPAFPGYYGPTPSYPTFQLPSDKFNEPIEEEEETYTSPNDFVNFPPVRNPNLNMSATSSSVTSDLELSTPAFIEDTILKNKMNTLVHKIVESLQGNFEALADMIDDSNNTAAGFSEATSPTTTLVTRRPSTKAPTRKPAARPTRVPTRKPPTRVSTPATTKRPASVTTKRPATATTRRTTTKKPVTRKPTRKSTTTTTTAVPIQEDQLLEGEEEINNEVDSNVGEDADESERKFKCGIRPHVKSGRIVGGKGATFGEFPWQVLVRESTWLGLFTKNKCGGVLITNKYVITAAHCQPGFLASLVAVMGEFDISGDLEAKRSVTKNVKRVIVHRQYDPATFENDLALLELESPVKYDTHIVPICMPSDTADFTGRMATVTGWGRLKYGGGVPSVLQEVQVPIIENSVCQEMFHTAGHNKKILNSFLCAGYANGQKDSCEGDSGGPLVLLRSDGRYELAGTVSHGIKCAAPYLPGVYMRTTYYKPWLRSITGVK